MLERYIFSGDNETRLDQHKILPEAIYTLRNCVVLDFLRSPDKVASPVLRVNVVLEIVMDGFLNN